MVYWVVKKAQILPLFLKNNEGSGEPSFVYLNYDLKNIYPSLSTQ